MANITHSIFSFLLIINIIFLSFSCYALARPGIPKIKYPNPVGSQGGTVLIPGIGRVVARPKVSRVNPIKYNPITGYNNGNGLIVPDPSRSGIGIGTYIPGGGKVPSGGTP